VNAATHRSDVEYVWPPTLIRPSKNVRLVYLDQAQWIYLAQAATGHPVGGQYVASLEALRLSNQVVWQEHQADIQADCPVPGAARPAGSLATDRCRAD
jgi:hypothetical protein